MQPLQTPLLLVRHGQTPWNAEGRWQGHANPGLSALGRSQAEAIARALLEESEDAEPPWSHIVASDLARARETAEILSEVLSLPISLDLRLRELDVGDWTGLTRAEVEALDPETLRAFESGEPSVRPGGGECRMDIRQRARDCIRDLAKQRAGQRVVVVTHLGVIRALVPGAEPDNATCIPVVAEQLTAHAIESRRQLEEGPL